MARQSRKGWFGPHDMNTPEGQAEQEAIAAKGGRMAHQKGTAHEWTSDEARNVGRKGGEATRDNRRKAALPPAEDIGRMMAQDSKVG